MFPYYFNRENAVSQQKNAYLQLFPMIFCLEAYATLPQLN
jgi:hypothetical protein